MKTLFLTFALFVMAALPAHAMDHMQKDGMHEDHPKLTLVKYYADWCASCKILDPEITKAKAMDGTPAFNHIIFDLTNDDTKAKSAKMAEEKGLSEFFDASGKTGYAVIINAHSKQTLARVTKVNDADDIVTILKAVEPHS